MIRSLLLGLALLVMATPAIGAENTFITQVLILGDITPPTTPANLVGVTINQSQIDLDWDASTDNVGVTGYQIFRDGSQIATTSLTVYSDSDLSIDTLYSYYVVAFDAEFNYSSSSNITTPDDSTNTSRPEESPIEIVEHSIVPEETKVAISIRTNLSSNSTVRWGQTVVYESGYAVSRSYKRDHEIMIDDLLPGTNYRLEVTFERPNNGETLTKTFSFSTKELPDQDPPANVSFFTATKNTDNTLKLQWSNPEAVDFSHVQIFSSDQIFPRTDTDGWFVYRGDGERITDERRLVGTRYYTIFAYDKAGNRSSGAVAVVRDGEDITNEEGVFLFSKPSSENKVDDPALTEAYKRFVGVTVRQDRIEVSDGEVSSAIFNTEPATFSIPYDVLPPHLKTIVVTLVPVEKNTKSFSFMLRINKEATEYEATVGPLLTTGLYKVYTEVYDYQATQVIRTSQMLTVIEQNGEQVRSASQKLIINWPVVVGLLLIFYVLIHYLYALLYRRG